MSTFFENSDNHDAVYQLPVSHRIPQQTNALRAEPIMEPTNPGTTGLRALHPFMRKPCLLPLLFFRMQESPERIRCDH